MQPEQGWYADPEDASRHRWWDGEAWTDHVQPAPSQGGLISSGRIAHPPPVRSRRTISGLLLPPALVATVFMILLTFASQRTTEIPDRPAAERAAETLGAHLQDTFGFEPSDRFSGSAVDNPDAANEMYMALTTCASDPLRHQDLTSIAGAEVREPSVVALLMIGTGDRDANHAYVEGLVAQSRACAAGDSGRDQLQLTVEEEGGRLQLIDIQQQGEGTPTTWVFVARADANQVASGYVNTTMGIDGAVLAEQLLDGIDAAMDAAAESGPGAAAGTVSDGISGTEVRP